MALLDRLRDTVQHAREGGQTVGRMGGLKLEMTKAQAKIGELFADIGIQAYKLYKKKELTHEGLNGLFAQIDELTKQVDRNKTDLDGILMKIDVQNQDNAQSRLAGIAERAERGNPPEEEPK
jgi:hypothetical protein